MHMVVVAPLATPLATTKLAIFSQGSLWEKMQNLILSNFSIVFSVRILLVLAVAKEINCHYGLQPPYSFGWCRPIFPIYIHNMRCNKLFYDTQNDSSNLLVSSRMILYLVANVSHILTKNQSNSKKNYMRVRKVF